MRQRYNFLFYSAVYPPDPASVGQHIADVAVETAHRGHRVRMLTSDRGYDNPSLRYPLYEWRSGVEIIRLRWCSFGKKSFFSRILGQCSFTLQVLFHGMIGFRPDAILVSTIPPFGVVAALPLSKFKKSSIVFWVMDINPDEAVCLGLVGPNSWSARFMEFINKKALRVAKTVITLDPYMKERIKSKIAERKCVKIIPPWPYDDTFSKSKEIGQSFRKQHGLEDKFIIMYSGNHSWVHPIDTILQAAEKLIHRTDIVFLFVGGGTEKRKVERAIKKGLPNIRSLPYQPFEQLGESLSAADVHVVTMGENMVGIVHPCKIYGAMAVKRPILAIAPDESHISEIVEKNKIGFRLGHGDINGVINAIIRYSEMGSKEIKMMGEKAGYLVRTLWNQSMLRKKFVDLLEQSALKKE